MLENVRMHPEAVPVEDEDAVIRMASSARLVVNCLTTEQSMLLAVARACARTKTHYIDLAVKLSGFLPTMAVQSETLIVPGCGLDYAFFDVAIAETINEFSMRYPNDMPTRVDTVLAFRPGPLGFKWTTQELELLFTRKPSKKSPTNTPAGDWSNVRLLSRCPPFSCWSIPFFFAQDAIEFLTRYRTTTIREMDIRVAILLWKGLACVAYGIFLFASLLPFIFLAFYCQVIRELSIKALPFLTFGFLTNNGTLFNQSMEQVGVQLWIRVSSASREIARIESAPSVHHLQHICTACAAMALARSSGKGAMTPAQALLETDYRVRVQQMAPIKVEQPT